MTTLVLLSVLFLSFFNGANDNFKGVATVYGAGVASYRTALAWGTVTTAAGALLAPVLAPGLIGMFKAKGLVPDAIYKLPLSTTHVTTGGIVGVGATRGSVVWSTIGKIALAWVTTLPTAIAFGAVLELVISRI